MTYTHRHLEMLYLAADGHFGLMRKEKVDDPDDVALTENMAFFPDPDEHEAYLKVATDCTEVLSRNTFHFVWLF